MASHYKLPMLTKENYDIWKIRMQSHLAALDDDMWFVITDGPIKIQKISTATLSTEGAPQLTEKPRHEWTAEDKRKANLDNVAKNTLYDTLDNDVFRKIKYCSSAKEIWEKIIQMFEESNSGISLSDEEEEIIACFLAKSEEVCDSTPDSPSKFDLVNTINEMVVEYKKLSDSFNEIHLKNRSDSTDFQINSLKNKLNELSAENDKLKQTVQESILEIKRLNYVVSTWTRSGADPKRLHEQTSGRLPNNKRILKEIRMSAGETANRLKPFKILKTLNGKSIRIIQVWIIKRIIDPGPN